MRLADQVLKTCLYDHKQGLTVDPARNFGLSKRKANTRMKALRKTLDMQQQLLWANSGPSILVWLQGPDCSGKDGAIRNSLRGLNPQGIRISDFKKPTESEFKDNFLARYRKQVPTPGRIVVFNRTPYEGLVSDFADGYIDTTEAASRLEQLLEFEAQLAADNIHLIKIYMHISRDEQKNRLKQRFIEPEKHWKISAADLYGHKNFDATQRNWNQAFTQSSTEAHPWHILPANHKHIRNLLVCSLIEQHMEKMDLQWPQPELPFTVEDLDK